MKHWVDLQLEFKIIQGGSLTKINHCKENSIRKIFPEIQNTKTDFMSAMQSLVLVYYFKLLDLELYFMIHIKPRDGMQWKFNAVN